jgi:N-acetylglucosamine-6-sulfatase
LTWHRTVSVAVALTLLSCSGGEAPVAPATPSPAATRRPNIVLVLADDMTLADYEAMPGLKALLTDRGVTFRQAFTSIALCCPSRASILTGQYAHNHGVVRNALPDGGFIAFLEKGREAETVAVGLKTAGYRTALIGKYLNGYPADDPTHVPPGWDEWQALYGDENENRYGAYFNYTLNANGREVQYGSGEQDYETDVLARLASDFIRRTAVDPARPFFLYLSPSAPHLPATPAPRHAAAFPGASAPRVPSFDEDDMSDKPAFMRGLPPLTDRDLRLLDRDYRTRLQSLLSLEDLVNNVLQALAASGQLENTYVFFFSDNGFLQGHHRFPSGKDVAYEEAIHMPLVVRGPGVPPGTTREHMAMGIDLAPTFLSLAGVTVPASMDGRSLAPLLGASPPPLAEWRQEVLIEHFGTGRKGELGTYGAIRTADHKYVFYEATGETELYDLRRDPYELDSVHDSAPPAIYEPLARRLDVLRTCRGSGCR